jgi:hypothetical protein
MDSNLGPADFESAALELSFALTVTHTDRALGAKACSVSNGTSAVAAQSKIQYLLPRSWRARLACLKARSERLPFWHEGMNCNALEQRGTHGRGGRQPSLSLRTAERPRVFCRNCAMSQGNGPSWRTNHTGTRYRPAASRGGSSLPFCRPCVVGIAWRVRRPSGSAHIIPCRSH